MFLLDTNCRMQIARDRAHAGDVREPLANVPQHRLFVSIYTVHSIGTVLARRGSIAGFAEFSAQSSIGVGISVVALPIDRLRSVEEACLAHRLDFDDACQYVAAELHGLRHVSLDADFDRTPNGRLTPAAALQLFKDEQTKQQSRQNP